jgi:mannose-1-phosphate guanylyltransferase
MAGGAGTRFWPASTSERPKQFLRFFGERTLLQMSWDRARAVCPPENIWILTAERFVPLVREQLTDALDDRIVGEPLRRDTAAAVALAVALAEHHHHDPVLAVLTADHLISPTDVFAEALQSAAEGARSSDALYTFGIAPDHPATGFGYLEVGDVVGEAGGHEHRALERFVEKPDAATAQGYLESGRFLWNSGMFIYRTSVMAAQLEAHVPAHLEHLRPAARGERSLAEAFEPLEKISIDFAVMEKAPEVRCLKAPFDWSDVGGFNALAEHLPHDGSGNTHRGAVQALDSHRNIVFSDDDDELVALIGVDDLIVVRAGRRTLICPRDKSEQIKALVAALPEDER